MVRSEHCRPHVLGSTNGGAVERWSGGTVERSSAHPFHRLFLAQESNENGG